MLIFEPVPLFNAIMAGLISSSGACGYVTLLGACIIGVVSGIFYTYVSKLVKKLEIDDPLSVTATHLTCGVWGILSVGILHQQKGLFYIGTLSLFFNQVIYVFSLILWGSICSAGFFMALQTFNRLRIDQIYEIIGIDLLTHSSQSTALKQ